MTTTKGTSQIVTSASDVLDTTHGLTNNGGPTQTIAGKGPAVDAIPSASCTYPAGSPNPCTTTGSFTNQLTCDQRGESRPDGTEAFCDHGFL